MNCAHRRNWHDAEAWFARAAAGVGRGFGPGAACTGRATMTRDYEPQTKGLYRSRNGVIFGVCKGVSDYLDVSVFWTRVIAVLLFFFTGIWPVLGIYILAAFLMKPAPVVPFRGPEDAEFYNSYTSSRTMALQRLKRTFDNLDRRIQRIESIVTARDYDWERRLHE